MAAEYGESLSERELEITQLVAEGLTNREVANRLYLSHNTVKVHLRNIFAKTGVASRTELSMLAVQEGWIEVPILTDELSNGSADQPQAPVASGIDSPEQDKTEHLLPAWSRQRWATLTLGAALALLVLLLPQRQATPASTAGPGDVFSAGVSGTQTARAATGEDWQEMAPLPVRRAGMGVTTHSGGIYVIGGMTDQGPSGRVDIYDVEENAWREGTPRPVELAHVSAVTMGDEILVPGGCRDDAVWTPSTAVHLYNPQKNTWREARPLPTALCAYALSTDGERVYLFGGWDGTHYRALTYAYDPQTDTWEELAPPEQARGYAGAALLADRIFYVGGYDGEREWATCEMYILATDTWERCRPMLQPRGGLSLVAIAGHVYAIGGGWRTPLGFNERYTPVAGEWNVVETPIVSEWRNLGAVSYDTALYATGGWSGTDFLNRTYTVEVMPWRIFIPGSYRSP